MYNASSPQTALGATFRTLELIYHLAVRNVRSKHANAVMAIVNAVLQMVLMVGMFYVMFTVLGLRGLAVRGDFLVYIMTGIFLYLSHIQAVGAVSGSGSATNPLLQHAPMNTAIAMAGSVLAGLYVQTLSAFLVLFVYHVAFTPVEIDDPIGAYAMFLLAYFCGLGVGMIFLALKPWMPSLVSIFERIYQRANMIASGKMFLANTLPGYMLAMFDWNPLFHCIDQARGYAFNNYFPRNSSWEYALWVGIVLLMIGLMGEFYTRKHVSASWSARR